MTGVEISRRIAIAGAGGYVGGRLLDELIARRDVEIVAPARTPAKLEDRAIAAEGRLVVRRADVLDPDSLPPVLEGVDVAYYLVHSMDAGADFHSTDLEGARNFGAACAEAGVARIVYLSGLGAEGDSLSEHLSSRHATGDALREAGVPVTELRAAIIVGSGGASFEIVRDLSRRLPMMITPRWVRSRCEPIAIRDVVAYLVGVLDEPRTIGETLEIGGGDVLTYAEMLRICGEEQGHRCRILTVPVLTPRLSSYWLHLVTSVDMRIARPLIEGLRNDVICHDMRIREWIPLRLSDYRSSVRRALDRERERTVRESRWTDASRLLGPVAAHDGSERSAGRRPRLRIAPGRDAFVETRRFEVPFTLEETYDRISRIGGDFGYGAAANLFWRIRGALDRLVGGPGLRRGRPFGSRLRPGDAVDMWRVAVAERPVRLAFNAEMLLPGRARLEYRIEPADGGVRVTQTATLTNERLLSGLYWYAVYPFHKIVFTRLGRHLLGDGSVD